MLAVTDGAVSRVDTVDSEGKTWAITVTPDSWAPITIRIAADVRCNRPEAICTGDGRRLFNPMELVVPARPNTPPTGAPAISGEVEVGTTLTADTSGISDADGLTAATFTYQWISVFLIQEADIPGATGPTYTPVSSDAGKAIKVRVSFTDDAGKTESLTSPARTERPHTLTAATSDGAVVLTWETATALGLHPQLLLHTAQPPRTRRDRTPRAHHTPHQWPNYLHRHRRRTRRAVRVPGEGSRQFRRTTRRVRTRNDPNPTVGAGSQQPRHGRSDHRR